MKSTSSYSIGVVFPSRGLVMAETFKELLSELSGIPHRIYWSHGNSLPACFNKPLSRALRGSHSHIWIVEDDMVLKPGILKQMLEQNKDIVACDYPISAEPSATVYYDKEDRPLFTGTGCLLARTEVFKQMPKPWFRADIAWQFKREGDKIRFEAHKQDPDKGYGFHDITFGLYHYSKGTTIHIMPTILAQRKLAKKGEKGTNIGADNIQVIDKHKKMGYETMVDFEGEEVKGDLVLVELDGREMYVQKQFAEKNNLKPLLLEAGGILLDFRNFKSAERYFL